MSDSVPQQRTVPSIALDLDGTIDEAPVFFQFLSKCWPGTVYVITYRSDQAKRIPVYLRRERDQRLHVGAAWDRSKIDKGSPDSGRRRRGSEDNQH